jgi:hypothetical protein
MSDQPKRWLDSEIPAELREVLGSAEDDLAQTAQVSRLQSRLEMAIGPAFSGAASGSETQPQASATGSGSAIGSGAAIGGALAIATALIVGLGAVWFGTHTPEAQPQHAAPATPQALVIEQLAPIAEVAPGLRSESIRVSQPSAAAPKLARPASPLAQGGGLIEELKQLEAIRRRVPAQPARALTAIAQHARRFPQGTLGPERELLRIEALQRLGRSAEAQQAADKALSTPGHPYAAQIRQLMAADGR